MSEGYFIITMLNFIKNKKKYLLILSLLLIGITTNFLKVTSETNFEVKETISYLEKQVDIAVTLPSNILFATIASDFSSNTETFINELNYFTTIKLKFPSSPFHYIVDQKGGIYRTNHYGDDAKIDISGLPKGTIVIGYIGNVKKGDFTTPATESLKRLSLSLANLYNIEPKNFYIGDITFQKGNTPQNINLIFTESLGNWTKTLEDIRNFVTARFIPIKKDYNISVLNIGLSNTNSLPEEVLDVTISLQNNSDSNIFEGSANEIIFTKKGNGASIFHDPNSWLSNTQAKLMPENGILKKQEITEYKFKIKAPLSIGRIQEEFEIRTFNGQVSRGSQVQLSIDVLRPNYRIIEVPNNRGFSQMNLRENPSSVANVIGFVSSGQRFKVLEDAGNGYIKIRQSNGIEGWIAGWLVNEI